jgi:hypothetical protein
VFRAYTDPEPLPRRLGPRDLAMIIDRYDGRTLVRTISTFQSG